MNELMDERRGRQTRQRSRAFTLPCDPAIMRSLRQELLRDDAIAAAAEDQRANVLLSASELVANAIAASTGPTIRVVVETGSTQVVIAVRNHGVWLEPPAPDALEIPPPRAGRGRGLAIVAGLAEDLSIRVDRGFTTVAARFRL